MCDSETKLALAEIQGQLTNIDKCIFVIERHLAKINGSIETHAEKIAELDKNHVALETCVKTTTKYVEKRQEQLGIMQEEHEAQSIKDLIRKNGQTILFLMFLLGLLADLLKDWIK